MIIYFFIGSEQWKKLNPFELKRLDMLIEMLEISPFRDTKSRFFILLDFKLKFALFYQGSWSWHFPALIQLGKRNQLLLLSPSHVLFVVFTFGSGGLWQKWCVIIGVVETGIGEGMKNEQLLLVEGGDVVSNHALGRRASFLRPCCVAVVVNTM